MQRKIVGIVSILIGISMLAYNWFNYVPKKKSTEIGPLKTYNKQISFVQWPPFIGIMLIVGGIAIVVSSKKS